MKLKLTIFIFLISNNVFAIQNESSHVGVKYYSYDCMSFSPENMSDQAEAVRSIIDKEFQESGLAYRSEEIAKSYPQTSLETAFVCFSFHAVEKESGFSVLYHLELRQFAFLARDLQKGVNNPLKLPTTTSFYNNFVSKKNMGVLYREIQSTAAQVARDVATLNKEPEKTKQKGPVR